jgi:thioredoxin reductase
VYTGYSDPSLNLRWDWNSLLAGRDPHRFTQYTGKYFPDADDFVRYLADYAQRFSLRIRFHTRVRSISNKDRFTLVDDQGAVYRCRVLIVATGLTKPYVPPIPGVELAELYGSVSVDPDDFRNQRVLIVGKGNSAFETADNLIPTAASIHVASPHSVRMAWQTHYVGHLRAVNNQILDTYQLKLQNAILDASIAGIERVDGRLAVTVDYAHAGGERETLSYDRVILCTGFRFDASIFEASCRPELVINDRYPAQTSAWESVNVPNLYFAGTLMHMRDYRRTNSGFVHGFRYNIEALHRILRRTSSGVGWPCQEFPADPRGLCDTMIRRVNLSSAQWQQPGFVGDIAVVDPEARLVRYYEDMPLDYAHDVLCAREPHYYALTLEYGPDHASRDPFSAARIERHDAQRAALSSFLHPVIRVFNKGTLTAEHHVIEDLAAEWREEIHVQPLLAFLQRDIQRAEPAAVAAKTHAIGDR